MKRNLDQASKIKFCVKIGKSCSAILYPVKNGLRIRMDLMVKKIQIWDEHDHARSVQWNSKTHSYLERVIVEYLFGRST